MSSESKAAVQPTMLSKYVTEIDHVAIAVRNLEESIKFYTEALGFELKERRASRRR